MASNQHLVTQAEIHIGVAQETYELIIKSRAAANEALTTAIAQNLQSLRCSGQELLEFTKEQKTSYERQKESYEEEVESLTRDKEKHELEKENGNQRRIHLSLKQQV